MGEEEVRQSIDLVAAHVCFRLSKTSKIRNKCCEAQTISGHIPRLSISVLSFSNESN